MKKGEQIDGYIIRLQNNASFSQKATLKIGTQTILLVFNKYEVKTIVYDDNSLKEKDEMYI